MSESRRNDGRIWAPMKAGGHRGPGRSRDRACLSSRAPVRASGNLVRGDVASRVAKNQSAAGRGVSPTRLGVYLDFTDVIERFGGSAVETTYASLFAAAACISRGTGVAVCRNSSAALLLGAKSTYVEFTRPRTNRSRRPRSGHRPA